MTLASFLLSPHGTHDSLSAISRDQTSTVAHESRNLPGAGEKFEDLRKSNKAYVDKTNYIAKLLKQDSRFLSICRPRYFGKSNFLQMLNAYFLANRTLFEGLDVYATHDWQPHPVIYLDFNTMDVRTLEDFEFDLKRALRQIGESYGYTLSDTETPQTLFGELIYELSANSTRFESVVVLVDEYEWPVRRNADADNFVEVWELTRFLREFFVEVNTYKDKIKLLVMTCTAPFQIRNYRGSLQHLKDITYDPEFSEMIGLTQTELLGHFGKHIEKMARAPKETFDTIVADLRRRYHGYCFSEKTNSSACRLYNYHSVISALRNENITNYWHPSVNPKYNRMSVYQKEEYQRHAGTLDFFTNYTISRAVLKTQMNFNLPVPLIMSMIIYGYLTLSEYKEATDEFVLNFPNEEVRDKFIKEELEGVPLGQLPVNEVLGKCETLRQTMFGAGQCEQFIENLNQMTYFDRGSETADAEENEVISDEVIRDEIPVAPVTVTNYPDPIVRVFQICNIKNSFNLPLHMKNFTIACMLNLEAEIANSNERYVFELGPVELAMKKLLTYVKVPEFEERYEEHKVYLMAMDSGELKEGEGGPIQEWIRVTYELGRISDVRSSHPRYREMFANVTTSDKDVIDRKRFWRPKIASSRAADRALYKKLKENPGYFSDMNLVEGVRTRLNEENERLEVMLYDYGYLSIKPTFTEEPDGYCTLYFPSFDAEVQLMSDLIYGAELEDTVFRDTLSIIRKSFSREPPDADGFAFIMQGIGTIARQLPYLKFPDYMFYKLAVLGALRCCGLEVTFGDTLVDSGIVYCDHMLNHTRLVLEMQFEGDKSAQKFWDGDFKNRLRITAHHRRPRRTLLGCVMMFSGEQKNPVRDWYGQYLYYDPDGNLTIYTEYKNPESAGSGPRKWPGSADANMYEQLTVE